MVLYRDHGVVVVLTEVAFLQAVEASRGFSRGFISRSRCSRGADRGRFSPSASEGGVSVEGDGAAGRRGTCANLPLIGQITDHPFVSRYFLAGTFLICIIYSSCFQVGAV